MVTISRVVLLCFDGVWWIKERYHMLWFLGLGGRKEKVSHVTDSGVWEGQGKGVTCNGFCGLEGEGERCHM
jgi:hypothetical protein